MNEKCFLFLTQVATNHCYFYSTQDIERIMMMMILMLIFLVIMMMMILMMIFLVLFNQPEELQLCLLVQLKEQLEEPLHSLQLEEPQLCVLQLENQQLEEQQLEEQQLEQQ